MTPFTTLTGIAAPMPLVNIDTDMIIPKQFLKTIHRSGLGKNLFDEMRYNPDGSEVALRDERQRVAIVDYEDLGERQLRMAALFDGDGEYEIGEFGFYLASGTLLAVYSVAGKLLTYKAAAARVLQKFTLDVSPLPADSVTIVVGSENLNLLLAEEIAIMAAASVGNMSRHVDLMFRLMHLEAK